VLTCRDRSKRPEEENTVRGHLTKLMTSHIMPLNTMVAEFLLVLCKDNCMYACVKGLSPAKSCHAWQP
jgi:hypothetical protein